MAQQTDAQLTTEKNVIKNETTAKANTATRVGTMVENVIDSKINNDKIETDAAMVTSGKTVAGRDAVKAYIAAQLAALDQLFLGLYISLAALETAHATAESGQYAIVDPGSGTDAVKYIWDEDEGWVAGGGSGGGDFATLTGDPYDNTALEAALNAKQDIFETTRDVTGAHTLDATDLGHVNDGENYVLNNTTSGVLTLPLNATVDFPESTLIRVPGFTTVAITGGGTVNGTNGTLNVVGDDSYVSYLGSNTWTLYNGEPAANTSTAGLVELATEAEVVTGTDTARAATPAGVKAAIDALIAPTSVTPSGSLTINSVSGSLLTLNCASKEESKFKYIGDTSPMSLDLTNFLEGAVCSLTIERSTSANMFIRFKDKTYLLSDTQFINNGKDPLTVLGRASGRTVSILLFYKAAESGAQDNQGSPATTNLVQLLKYAEDTEV